MPRVKVLLCVDALYPLSASVEQIKAINSTIMKMVLDNSRHKIECHCAQR